MRLGRPQWPRSLTQRQYNLYEKHHPEDRKEQGGDDDFTQIKLETLYGIK